VVGACFSGDGNLVPRDTRPITLNDRGEQQPNTAGYRVHKRYVSRLHGIEVGREITGSYGLLAVGQIDVAKCGLKPWDWVGGAHDRSGGRGRDGLAGRRLRLGSDGSALAAAPVALDWLAIRRRLISEAHTILRRRDAQSLCKNCSHPVRGTEAAIECN
jgi:hypothetical protein